jgi:hypothetical protein
MEEKWKRVRGREESERRGREYNLVPKSPGDVWGLGYILNMEERKGWGKLVDSPARETPAVPNYYSHIKIGEGKIFIQYMQFVFPVLHISSSFLLFAVHRFTITYNLLPNMSVIVSRSNK